MGDIGGLGDLLGGYGSDDADSQDASPERSDHAPKKINIEDDNHHQSVGIHQNLPPPEDIPQPMETEIQKDGTHIEQEQHPKQAPSNDQNDQHDHDIDQQQNTDNLSFPSFDVLPPEFAPPPGTCDPNIQERVAKWSVLQSQGRYLTDELRNSRAYRNPEFFKKMIEYWDIDEYGTSLPKDVFDPESLPESDTIVALLDEYRKEDERRRETRAAGTARIEFTRPSSGVVASSTDVQIAAATAKAKAAAAKAAAGSGRRRP